METLNNNINEISEKLLLLSKSNDTEALKTYTDSLDDDAVFSWVKRRQDVNIPFEKEKTQKIVFS